MTFLVEFLLVWVVLQDFVLSLLYNLTNATTFIKLLLYSKDLIFWILVGFSIVKELSKGRGKKKLLPIFFLVALVVFFLVGALLNPSNLSNVYVAFRSIALLPGCYLIGRNIIKKEKFRKFTKGYFNVFLTVVAILGIVEYLVDITVGDKTFWTDVIGVTDYFTDIKGQGDRLVEGLPGNFYGSYGQGYFSVKRLSSIWINPLTAAYSLLLPTLYYWYQVLVRWKNLTPKEKQSMLLHALLFAAALLLTNTRGIILPFLVCIVIFLFKSKSSFKYFALFAIFAGALAFVIVKMDSLISYLYDGSTMGHIDAIQSGLSHMTFLGTGLATVGITSSSAGTESQYLSILGQTGLVMFVFYIALEISMIRELAKVKNYIGFVSITAFVCLILTGLISEQLGAFTTIFPSFVILAFVPIEFKDVIKTRYLVYVSSPSNGAVLNN